MLCATCSRWVGTGVYWRGYKSSVDRSRYLQSTERHTMYRDTYGVHMQRLHWHQQTAGQGMASTGQGRQHRALTMTEEQRAVGRKDAICRGGDGGVDAPLYTPVLFGGGASRLVVASHGGVCVPLRWRKRKVGRYIVDSGSGSVGTLHRCTTSRLGLRVSCCCHCLSCLTLNPHPHPPSPGTKTSTLPLHSPSPSSTPFHLHMPGPRL